jgi:hypothetical protein
MNGIGIIEVPMPFSVIEQPIEIIRAIFTGTILFPAALLLPA